MISINSKEGVVYVLVNDAMPNYVKIGKTTDLKKRLSSLYNTSVPLPFEIFYAAVVPDMDFAEKQIHLAFSDKRIRNNREFFSISPDQVVAILKLIELKPALLEGSQFQQSIEISKERNRRKPFNFQLIKLSEGTELMFTNDAKIKAYVASDLKHVIYNGVELSLSAAAAKIIQSDYPLQGTIYWTYNGKTLDEIRRENESNNEDSF